MLAAFKPFVMRGNPAERCPVMPGRVPELRLNLVHLG